MEHFAATCAVHDESCDAWQGADSVEGYFPQGVWYNLSDVPTVDASTTGRHVAIPAPLTSVPVHVLGGSIVPMQARFAAFACRLGLTLCMLHDCDKHMWQEARLTSAEVARTRLTLVVALSRTPLGSASIDVQRCGPLPADRALLARTAGRTQAAWGQLYVDRGDQKELGPADSGWLNLRAEAQPYGTGVLTGIFSSTGEQAGCLATELPRAALELTHLACDAGEWDGADGQACAQGLFWPVLDGVRILGLPGKIDEASIKFEVISPGEAKLATHAVPASKARASPDAVPFCSLRRTLV